MLLGAETNIVYKLFQHDPDYSSHTAIPIEYRLQFLFFSVAFRLHVPSIVRSLAGNYAASCRDLDKILREYEDSLPLKLLSQLKRVLHNYNPTSFMGHLTAD